LYEQVENLAVVDDVWTGMALAPLRWKRAKIHRGSRLAGADEDRTLSRLRGLRSDLIDPAIAAHHGRVVKRTGDGIIIEFRSVVDAVNCAIEVQRAMVERNAEVAPDKRIEFRVGIHLGDVVEESDGDLMGDGVNIAARLEGVWNAPAGSLQRFAVVQLRHRPHPACFFFRRDAPDGLALVARPRAELA
jgi:hypothetical protein